jgi:hypothetical protein
MAALALLAVAIVGALAWTGEAGRASSVSSGRSATDSGADAAAAAQYAEPWAIDAGTTPELFFASIDAAAAISLDDEVNAGVSLPARSPKTVRLGVILVQYRGAQTADPMARSKQEALAMARSIAEAAKVDFKSQLSKGDPGSLEDAGRIPRGVLEPAAEYTVFTLNPGDVSEPIDTPRGFWIVRRIE